MQIIKTIRFFLLWIVLLGLIGQLTGFSVSWQKEKVVCMVFDADDCTEKSEEEKGEKNFKEWQTEYIVCQAQFPSSHALKTCFIVSDDNRLFSGYLNVLTPPPETLQG
ncbi:MAG TPA: hypothetical protein ENJ39_08890 [Flammeovirgaceae bacterium]|nr:hypothetical protein [Flammeovirgaceae bacterium]